METQKYTRCIYSEQIEKKWQQLKKKRIEPKQWDSIDWYKTNQSVQHLRSRIFVATQRVRQDKGSNLITQKKLRKLQEKALFSYDTLLLAVRRVTQKNIGKNSSHTDTFVIPTKEDRFRLILLIRFYVDLLHWSPNMVKQNFTIKIKRKKQINISIITDLIIQTIYHIALEPEWEARSDFGSYGFRPRRSSHDAIEKIFTTIKTKNFTLPRKQWIVCVDLKGYLNQINHDYLLEKIKGFPGQLLLKRWLKMGYINKQTFHDPNMLLPGSIIGPLLTNIALNGLEGELGITYRLRKQTKFPYFRYILNDYVGKKQKERNCGRRAFVRYGDIMVLLIENQSEIFDIKQDIWNCLKLRGLTLNTNCFTITHLKYGFDFLGVNIRYYKCRVKETKTKTNPSWGYKLLVKPSKQSIKKAQEKIKHIFQAHQGKTVKSLILNINPIIRGWCAYYRPFVSRKAMEKLDAYLYQRQLRFVYRTHSNKGKRWAVQRYFGSHCPHKPNDKWVFAVPKESKQRVVCDSIYMLKHRWVPIVRHHMVPNGCCPDDPIHKDFWETRSKTGQESNIVMIGDFKIAQAQRHMCPICGCSLYNNEQLEKHHIISKKNKGPNQYENLIFLHKVCHQKVSIDSVFYENVFRHYLKRVKKERAVILTKPVFKSIYKNRLKHKKEDF